MKYRVNYHTGAGNITIDTDDLDEVERQADEGAEYTQQPITIEDTTGKVIARRPWYGALDGLEDCSNPIQIGDYGYYDDWYEED